MVCMGFIWPENLKCLNFKENMVYVHACTKLLRTDGLMQVEWS